MATQADVKAESFFRGESMRGTVPPPQSPQQQAKDDKPQQPQQAPGGRAAGDRIAAVATNYSITPGPVWLEFVNQAAVSAGPVQGDVPLWGSGDMLSKLKLPLGCVIVNPTVTPAMQIAAQKQKQQKEQQQKQQKEKEQQQKQQKEKEQQQKSQGGQQPETHALPAVSGADLTAAQLAGMGAETQARHIVDDGLRAQYQEQISDEAQTLWGTAGPLTPEEQALTGMSPQGFPGLMPGLRSSALPTGMGVNGVTIDNTVVPAEVTVTLVGSGQVPANSRWLIFTIQGV